MFWEGVFETDSLNKTFASIAPTVPAALTVLKMYNLNRGLTRMVYHHGRRNGPPNILPPKKNNDI